MNLFTFKQTNNYRWAIECSISSIGLVKQYLDKSGKYDSSHTEVYEISVNKYFKFGFDHIYYDGPHCLLYIGFIAIQYNGTKWCKKCMPDYRS